jgi:hypothetical protein
MIGQRTTVEATIARQTIMAATATTAANRAHEVECGMLVELPVLPGVESLRDKRDVHDSQTLVAGPTCGRSTPTPTEC